MKAIYIDSLKIHDFADGTLKFFVMPTIAGLEYPATRVSSFDRSGQDGQIISNIFLGERRVTIEGKIYGLDSGTDYVTQRTNLISTLKPQKDANGLPIHRVLRGTGMDDIDYRLLVQVIALRMPHTNPRSSSFQIDLLGAYPYVEKLTATTTSVSTYTGGGAVYPVIYPVIMTAGSGGESTITNNGNGEAYPTITLQGPLTNPRIENVTLSKWIQLNLSISSGVTVVVDMFNRTIVQAGVTNRLSSLSADSQFWWLEAGDNTVRLTSGITGEAGLASVVHRDSYVGI